MERLKAMKEQLTSLVQAELGHCEQADTHELGEAIDMIKDLAETMYYCSITEAMEKGGQNREEEYRYYPYLRDMDRDRGKMYYPNRSTNINDMPHYEDRRIPEMYRDYPSEMRDHREGRSPLARRMYMETKEMHQDPAVQMKELEHYIQELGEDLAEMIKDATPEQKETLKLKISTLSEKIV